MAKLQQSEIKKAAQNFVEEWRHRGVEDKDYTEFWEDFLEAFWGVPRHERRLSLSQTKVPRNFGLSKFAFVFMTNIELITLNITIRTRQY